MSGDPPREEARPLEPGEVVDDAFRVEALIGQGGMARVYRARDLRGDRDVALKVLRGALAPKLLARMRREGELTAGLRHSGIVRIHASGEVEGQTYLVYELVEEARTLTSCVAELGREARLDVFAQVLDALAHAHEAGVVHRDLKPDNVLIGADQNARVSDFGIATQEGLQRLTQTGELVGTPRYMAPEQLRKAESPDPAADVWSLGVMLYELLTNEHPFPAANFAELVGRALRSRPPAPRQVDPSIGPGLERVCLRCLEKRPADRYPDAGALRTAFTVARAEAPTARRLAATLAVVGVLLVIGAVLVVAIHTQSDARVDSALQAALDANDPSAVRRALEHGGAPREVRSAAYLFLAELASDPDERLRWLTLAADLAATPAERARAERARAEALDDAGRFAEAAEAWGRVGSTAPSPGVQLAWARSLRAAGQPAEAARRGAEGGTDAGVRLALAALLDAGQPEAAAALLTQQAERFSLPEREAWQLEAGSDPAGALEALALRFPRSAAPALALKRLFVRRGQLRAAALALQAAQARGVSDRVLAVQLKPLLAVTRLGPTTVIRRQPLRGGAARWLLAEGERALAFRARGRDPRVQIPEGTPSSSDLTTRARAAFEAALRHADAPAAITEARRGLAQVEEVGSKARRELVALLPPAARASAVVLRLEAEEALHVGDAARALRHLDRIPEDDRTRSLTFLRGQALLTLGRAREAVAALRRSVTPDEDHPTRLELLVKALRSAGKPREAARMADRLARVRGSHREEAQALYRDVEERKAQKSEELIERYGAVLRLDPRHRKAYYRRGVLRTRRSGGAGLRACVRAITLDTRFLTKMSRTLRAYVRGGPFLSGSWVKEYGESDLNIVRGVKRLPGTIGHMFREVRYDRLAHLIARVHLVEIEGRADLALDSVKRLTDYLARFPGEPAAYVLRARVHLTLGRINEAARDLAVGREFAPRAGIVWFYVGLVRAARGGPAQDVHKAIVRGGREDYDVWKDDGWDPARHPMLAPYLKQKRFAFLLKPR